MTDTVTKLMGMVDLLCSACVDDVIAYDQAIPGYESCAGKSRQALQDELTRLFKPLTDEQIEKLWPGPEGTNSIRLLFRICENAHGITGERK